MGAFSTSSHSLDGRARLGLADKQPRRSMSLTSLGRIAQLRLEAREELERISSQAHLETKSSRSLRHKRHGKLAKVHLELVEEENEKWMLKRRMFESGRGRFTVSQKRDLRKWFDSLDQDGSGEIDTAELSNPLLATGIASNEDEVARLVQCRGPPSGTMSLPTPLPDHCTATAVAPRSQASVSSDHPAALQVRMVDDDESGAIGFAEFLKVLGCSEEADKDEKKSQTSKILALQELKSSCGGFNMSSIVCFERRRLLMDAILSEAMKVLAEHEDTEASWYFCYKHGDTEGLKQIEQRRARALQAQAKKAEFVRAVCHVTDFSREIHDIERAQETRGIAWQKHLPRLEVKATATVREVSLGGLALSNPRDAAPAS